MLYLSDTYDQAPVPTAPLLLEAQGSSSQIALNWSIASGQRTLVRGPDNAARFALLRATASVWHSGVGRIHRPALNQILFLAERPYLPPGTLRNIMLPSDEFWGVTATPQPQDSDQKIIDALQALGAENLVVRAGGFEHEQQWESLFTLNDQQLLACGRLLLLAPRFVFLERPAATLESPQIDRLLALLRARAITYVVFDKDAPDLVPYDQVLEIEQDGSWTSIAVTQERAAVE